MFFSPVMQSTVVIADQGGTRGPGTAVPLTAATVATVLAANPSRLEVLLWTTDTANPVFVTTNGTPPTGTAADTVYLPAAEAGKRSQYMLTGADAKGEIRAICAAASTIYYSALVVA